MAGEAKMQALLAALDGDQPVDVRIRAIEQLAGLRAVAAVPKLIELVEDSDFDVRMAAIGALGTLRDERAIPALKRIAHQHDGPLQGQAVTALIEIGTQKAFAAIGDLSAGAEPEDEPAESPPLDDRLVDGGFGTKKEEKKQDTLSEAPPGAEPPPTEIPDMDSMSPDEVSAWLDHLAERVGAAESLGPDASGEIDPSPGDMAMSDSRDMEDESEEEPTRSIKSADHETDFFGSAPPEPKPAPPPMPAPASPGSPPAAVAPQPTPRPQEQPPEPAASEEGEAGGRRERRSTSDERETIRPTGPRSVSPAGQEVQFSAYYPREVTPGDWQPLKAYVFKQSAADQIAEDAEKQLGPLAAFRRIVEGARRVITEGETITATPQLPGFQFNPPTAAISFFEDWHRFDFKMRAKDAPLNLAANGVVTFTVNGIIVADVPLSVFVTREVARQKPQATEPSSIYETIFASYSHKDTHIVEKVEVVAKSLGMDYLRDVVTLRSGENWSDGLQNMIDRATIFQLFWSPPYSVSPHCQHEWEYAVGLNREAAHFIRPVYWLQPMPEPPTQIAHLHFTYQPDLVK